MATIHIGLIGSDYWAAARNEKHFDARRFVRRDLERPLFEVYGFCGGWTQYSAVQSVALGLDLPAYVTATLLHSAINWRATCVDALLTPRGQIVTAIFVPPFWLVVGLSIRRLAQRRWRHATAGRLARAFVSLGLIPLPLGVFALLVGALGLFVSDVSLSARLAGFAFWMFYISTLSAERLRLRPFKSI
jgi:hypothetical protein